MNSLLELGILADRKLAAQGLTLTQGGEPTFVPHDPRLPEWSTAALGDEKLLFARRFARHLVDLFLPGAVVLQSFGKQYPGEPLPRWRLGLFRARDGRPLWSDLSRLRLESPPAKPANLADVEQFIAALAVELGIENSSQPVLEDLGARFLAFQSQSSELVMPRFSRKRLAFEVPVVDEKWLRPWQHLLHPAGYVLPLAFQDGQWSTGSWQLPDGKELTLLAGDSPVGLRLPLASLPKGSLLTALTAEVKQEELIVFLPPCPDDDAFCLLVQAVERVAVKLGIPAFSLEGYPPPDGSSLESIQLTADPGVIEVNLPPAGDWPRFEAVVRQMYQAAERTGLCAHKFYYTGRKVSTGGGAHIILGGPDLSSNPFIKRPNLLSSFLRFLQNHPSLSYAFTGLFMGPSSQAPRVDESAYEIPYELEISLRWLERLVPPVDPQMIDAMLRNLLLDCHGNTHRAELSVDKFHNAYAPNGRLGLIEFRAFEMMPTADMLLSMNLMIRALTACFSERPYDNPLVRWGNVLHDRFALPHFLGVDLDAVLSYLRERGFDVPPGLFQPHLDFRFPVITTWQTGNAHWVLRQALEPWPVMGEAAASRTVDASTDRLQLLVTGSDLEKFVAVVNGLRIPLHPQAGLLSVGAIRYRLFENMFGLQPQVRAHSPLMFDLIELASNRIVHSFDYANWRWQGGGYEGLPASEADAQSRVLERLSTRPDRCACTPNYIEAKEATEGSFTLDLRAY